MNIDKKKLKIHALKDLMITFLKPSKTLLSNSNFELDY